MVIVDSSRGLEGPGPLTGRQPAAMHGGNARFDEEVVGAHLGTDVGSLGCSAELRAFNNAARVAVPSFRGSEGLGPVTVRQPTPRWARWQNRVDEEKP